MENIGDNLVTAGLGETMTGHREAQVSNHRLTVVALKSKDLKGELGQRWIQYSPLGDDKAGMEGA